MGSGGLSQEKMVEVTPSSGLEDALLQNRIYVAFIKYFYDEKVILILQPDSFNLKDLARERKSHANLLLSI